MTEQLFIIRIWSEPRDLDQAEPVPRGIIEHVPTGKKQYIDNFNAILAFIAPYILNTDGDQALRLKIKQWLDKQKSIPVDIQND